MEPLRFEYLYDRKLAEQLKKSECTPLMGLVEKGYDGSSDTDFLKVQ
jgi:hypothetical protein